MLKKIPAFFLPVLFPFIVFAQDKIETDRPSETQNAGLISKGTFQAEFGFRKEHEEEQQYFYRYPNALFRYGLFSFLELRLNPIIETQQFASSIKSKHGLEPLEAGVKWRLYQTKDTSFILSFNGVLGIPRVASKDYELDKAFYRARLLLQNKITDKLTINYNAGRDWSNEDMEQNWMYSISPQYELSDKWAVLLEEYAGFQHGSAPEHYADIGATFGITSNLQLDINAGKGLSKNADDYFLIAGISFRIH